LSSFRSGSTVFDFDDEYFDALNRQRPLADVARLPLYEGAALEGHATKRNDIGLMQFLGKAYEVFLLLDLLSRHGLRRPFERALDIGSGAALHSRLLRTSGNVRHSEALDIYDGRRRCDDMLFWRHTAALIALYGSLRLFRCLPPGLQDVIAGARNRKLPVGVEAFSVRPAENVLTYTPRLGATLDAYHLADVFAVKGNYDLITSFMALDYFEFARIAAKVSELLDPGGVFAFLVSYWWYPVNNTLLYGRFPYALQRLSPDELLRYFRQVHPDISFEGVERRLGYSDQKRLTISDYEDAAYDVGLVPIAALRLNPDTWKNQRSGPGPFQIARRRSSGFDRLLSDTRRWKPRVQLSDLLTSHVMLVFAKPGASG
jgi:SAM-dependent methyltransferase